jgi:hypothetical protein
MLSQNVLKEDLVMRCLDVLRQLYKDERQLVLLVVEIVQDLRYQGTNEEDENEGDVGLFCALCWSSR